MRSMMQATSTARPSRQRATNDPRRNLSRSALMTAIVALVAVTASESRAQNVIVDETVLDSLGAGSSDSSAAIPDGEYPTIDIHNYESSAPALVNRNQYTYYSVGTVAPYVQPAVATDANSQPRELRYPPAEFPVSTLLVPPAAEGPVEEVGILCSRDGAREGLVEVLVRIDETRHDGVTCQVEDFVGGLGEVSGFTDLFDEAVANKKTTVREFGLVVIHGEEMGVFDEQSCHKLLAS